MSTEMLLTCVTPAHNEELVSVKVVVIGKGEALGAVYYAYSVQLDTISHCSG